jgi:4'-phosphopantetheinyl transferase
MKVSAGRWEAIPQGWTSLEADEVHVLSASLDLSAHRLEALAALLSADEHARAMRFFSPRDRDRFVGCRGLLRTMLGGYLDLAPKRLHFCQGAHGKPSLAPVCAGEDLRFNVSHSDDLALYAITRGRNIGVDVELVKPLADAAGIAERFFSPREAAALLSLPEPERQAAFFACWTRKEAYIKATGDGLTRPLDAFDVSVLPGLPARLVRVEGDSLEAARWSLAELRPAAGYAAALVVAGPVRRLSCWEWIEAEEVTGPEPLAHAVRSGELEVI